MHESREWQPELNPKLFTWTVRVYYEDTDSGGVVYYANYLKFMERARTEWLRAAGFDQSVLLNEHRVIFVVRSVAIEYIKPAIFDDALAVTVHPTHIGRSQIVFQQTVERGDVLTKAEVKIVCVNGDTFKPVKIPETIRQKLGNEN
ncbi:tol-pal system-associated acyl-CoA thioesterase [Sulfurirhabdus autotrophica]|uniref:tol-pal system-associated acyl-CoA thioesterase n=1 Tax=Sulfurirhabdus autotrophica TaxID=1706046 RepID=UPI001CB8E395|nr:tol-pal system-associated acyl-CoA thioesterase [Sulfurirhabdus autotrophica]